MSVWTLSIVSWLKFIRFEQRWSNKQLQKLLDTEHIRQHLIEVGLVGLRVNLREQGKRKYWLNRSIVLVKLFRKKNMNDYDDVNQDKGEFFNDKHSLHVYRQQLNPNIKQSQLFLHWNKYFSLHLNQLLLSFPREINLHNIFHHLIHQFVQKASRYNVPIIHQ